MQTIIDQIRPVPLECVWELTLACNLKCLHCGSAAGSPRCSELTTPQALDLVDQLAAAGCRVVGLSGGEPLLRPDWDQIARRCNERKLQSRLITNGWLFDLAAARRALDAGVSLVSFSLDGDEPTHDFLRGMPGSYRRIMRAIESAFEVGLPVVIITQCNRYNISQLESLYRLLADLGIRAWQIQITLAHGRAGRDILIHPADAWLIHDFIVQKKEQGGFPRLYAGDNIGYYTHSEDRIRDINQLGRKTVGLWLGCYAGVLVAGIESNGNVKGCLSLPPEFVEGNILRRSFRDIWQDPAAFAFNRHPPANALMGVCRKCDMREFCRGGCKSTAACGSSQFEFPFCLYQTARRLPDGEKTQNQPYQ